MPDLPFEAFEKLDGSPIVIYHHDGAWRTATKGSFDSAQARWAAERLPSGLQPGTTCLAEAVYPENRMVVHYAEAALVLLAAYDESGRELSYDEILATAETIGWRAARRHTFESMPAWPPWPLAWRIGRTRNWACRWGRSLWTFGRSCSGSANSAGSTGGCAPR